MVSGKVLQKLFFLFLSHLAIPYIPRDSIAIGVKWVTEYNTGTGMDSDLDMLDPRMRWVRTGIDDGGVFCSVARFDAAPGGLYTTFFFFFFFFSYFLLLFSCAKGLSI